MWPQWVTRCTQEVLTFSIRNCLSYCATAVTKNATIKATYRKKSLLERTASEGESVNPTAGSVAAGWHAGTLGQWL